MKSSTFSCYFIINYSISLNQVQNLDILKLVVFLISWYLFFLKSSSFFNKKIIQNSAHPIRLIKNIFTFFTKKKKNLTRIPVDVPPYKIKTRSPRRRFIIIKPKFRTYLVNNVYFSIKIYPVSENKGLSNAERKTGAVV